MITWLIFMAIAITANAAPGVWQNPILSPLTRFFILDNVLPAAWPALNFIDKTNETKLPAPYDFLLNQPLMTQAIATYYQRTPKVRKPLIVVYDEKKQQLFRAVIMIVDNNKQRDDALLADQQSQSTIAELGLININFSALPAEIIDGVLHTNTPFGALVASNQLKIYTSNTYFFKLVCNEAFAGHLNCQQGQLLYGRTNTLMRSDTQQWIAHVVEILM